MSSNILFKSVLISKITPSPLIFLSSVLSSACAFWLKDSSFLFLLNSMASSGSITTLSKSNMSSAGFPASSMSLSIDAPSLAFNSASSDQFSNDNKAASKASCLPSITVSSSSSSSSIRCSLTVFKLFSFSIDSIILINLLTGGGRDISITCSLTIYCKDCSSYSSLISLISSLNLFNLVSLIFSTASKKLVKSSLNCLYGLSPTSSQYS